MKKKKIKNNEITKKCAKDNCPPLCWYHVHTSIYTPEHFTPFLIYYYMIFSESIMRTFSTQNMNLLFPSQYSQRFSNFKKGGVFFRIICLEWFFIACNDWFAGWFGWHKLQLRDEKRFYNLYTLEFRWIKIFYADKWIKILYRKIYKQMTLFLNVVYKSC